MNQVMYTYPGLSIRDAKPIKAHCFRMRLKPKKIIRSGTVLGFLGLALRDAFGWEKYSTTIVWRIYNKQLAKYDQIEWSKWHTNRDGKYKPKLKETRSWKTIDIQYTCVWISNGEGVYQNGDTHAFFQLSVCSTMFHLVLSAQCHRTEPLWN